MISIITVAYNVESQIELTIKSILSLKTEHVEFIIVDGGSTDGTVDIIMKYDDQIDYWMSEKDTGIYNAMNKGIAKATGKYICFINAGDILLKIPFQELDQLESSIVAFPVKLSSGVIFYPIINDSIKLRNTLPHQGCYYSNTPNLLYDEKFKVFADFDLNQNYYKEKKEITVFKKPTVAFHNMDGISHNKKFSNEIFEVVKNNYGKYFQLRSFIYFKMQGLMSRLRAVKK